MPSARARMAARAAAGSPGTRPASRSAHRVVRQRIEGRGRRSAGDRRPRRAAAPGSSGRASVTSRIGCADGPLREVVDEVDEPLVRPVEVLEHEHRRALSPTRSKNVRQAPNSSSRPPARPPRRGPGAPAASARSSGAPPRRGRTPRASPRCRVRVVAGSSPSARPARRAHHLAQRPEGDALAVGGRPALVPEDRPRRARRCTC